MAARIRHREPWTATIEMPYAHLFDADELGLTDMLRYDEAYPESDIIDNCIVIRGVKPMGPTQARWESFGMRVIKAEYPRIPDYPFFLNWERMVCTVPDPQPPCGHCEWPEAHEKIDYPG